MLPFDESLVRNNHGLKQKPELIGDKITAVVEETETRQQLLPPHPGP